MRPFQEVSAFVQAALESVFLLDPTGDGLTDDEIVEVGRGADFEAGEVRDGLSQAIPQRHYERRGLSVRDIPHVAALIANFSILDADPDYRSVAAFDFVLEHLRALAAKNQAVNAKVDRAVLVSIGETKGLDKRDIEAAIEAYVLGDVLKVEKGIVSFKRPPMVHFLVTASEQIAQSGRRHRQERPMLALVYPLVQDLLEHRTDARAAAAVWVFRVHDGAHKTFVVSVESTARPSTAIEYEHPFTKEKKRIAGGDQWTPLGARPEGSVLGRIITRADAGDVNTKVPDGHVDLVLAKTVEVADALARRSPTPVATDPARPLESTEHRGPPERLFGKYDVLERLSPGGMAQVFKVREVVSGEVRFLKRVLLDSRDAASLEREQQIYNKLVYADVKHMVRVHAVERDHQFMALVTDFANQSLFDFMGERGGLPCQEAKAIAENVVAAIMELHALEIVHRDVKPNNVISHEGIWKLADFGIAKNTQVRETKTFRSAGTLGYAAPEQLMGADAQKSADVYSLGKVLVFLLTGQSDRDCVSPGPWHELIQRCTERIPNQRPSMDELQREIQRIPA